MHLPEYLSEIHLTSFWFVIRLAIWKGSFRIGRSDSLQPSINNRTSTVISKYGDTDHPVASVVKLLVQKRVRRWVHLKRSIPDVTQRWWWKRSINIHCRSRGTVRICIRLHGKVRVSTVFASASTRLNAYSLSYTAFTVLSLTTDVCVSVPDRYQNLPAVGSGAYGNVW